MVILAVAVIMAVPILKAAAVPILVVMIVMEEMVVMKVEAVLEWAFYDTHFRSLCNFLSVLVVESILSFLLLKG